MEVKPRRLRLEFSIVAVREVGRARRRHRADGPAFVDRPGRRLRRVRVIGIAVLGAIGLSVGLVLTVFAGGPHLGLPSLPFGPSSQSEAHRPTPTSTPGPTWPAPDPTASMPPQPVQEPVVAVPPPAPAPSAPDQAAPAPSAPAPATTPSPSPTAGKSASAPGKSKKPPHR